VTAEGIRPKADEWAFRLSPYQTSPLRPNNVAL